MVTAAQPARDFWACGKPLMSNENVKAFLKKLSEDKAIQDKFHEAEKNYSGDKNDRVKVFESVFVPVAKEAGITLTADDFKAYEEEAPAKVSAEELGAVAGGNWGNVEVCGDTAGVPIPDIPCQYVASYIPCILSGK